MGDSQIAVASQAIIAWDPAVVNPTRRGDGRQSQGLGVVAWHRLPTTSSGSLAAPQVYYRNVFCNAAPAQALELAGVRWLTRRAIDSIMEKGIRMSTDINGYIKVGLRHRFRGVRWQAAEKLSVMGHYDMFGCLFGIKNYANFRPLAPERGIPPDASPTVKKAVAEAERIFGRDTPDFYAETWITWAEIKAIDWNEKALAPDRRLHRYKRQKDGSLEYAGKSGWSGEWGQEFNVTPEQALIDGVFWTEGEREIGEHVYRAETLQRKDVLTVEWVDLFKTLEDLAAKYGDDLVRLVVWFDS